MEFTDEDLEIVIEDIGKAMVDAQSPFVRAALWERLKALISLRSPEQVARMERQKGLL